MKKEKWFPFWHRQWQETDTARSNIFIRGMYEKGEMEQKWTDWKR